ncbi:MAG: ABC transporter permease [Hyphomicrobiales bacterium]
MDLASFAQTAFAGFSNGALYALVALGFALVLRSTGLINFAQGDLMMLGGMISAVLAELGLPVIIAVPIAIVAGTALSASFYWLAIRPVASRATTAQVTLITIGLSICIRGAATTAWGSDPRMVPAFTGGAPFDIAGVSILPQELWLIGTLIAVTLLAALFFHRTTLGLAMRAAAVNPLGASFVGIDSQKLALVAFAGAGFVGALAGTVWGPINSAQVDMGLGVALKGFTAAILGGIHSNYGPILGGVLLALVESLSAGYISSAYQDTITFGLLLLALIVRPQGLLGAKSSMAKEDGPEEILSKHARPIDWSWHDGAKVAMLAVVLGGLGLYLSSTWLTSGIFAGIIALVVMGLVLLTGYGGQLSLGQGAFMMIGAYSSGFLTLRAGWQPVPALLFGVVAAVGLAYLLGRIIFVLRGYYLSMASFGLLMIALSVARQWESVTGGPTGLIGIAPFSIGTLSFVSDRAFYFLVLVVSLAVLIFCLGVARSRFGRALLAIRSSESAARACGVDLVAHKVRVFAVSAGCASLAGSLYAHYLSFANPTPFGIDASLSQLVALTAGGFLSLIGAYAGAAIVVVLPVIITLVVGSTANQLIAGLQFLSFGLLLIIIVHVQTRGTAPRFPRWWPPRAPLSAAPPAAVRKERP